jgi:DNA-binding transcriptional MerR regulator
MAEATLSIGQLADRAGFSVSAIRFYERRGLLPEPEREGGQRRYDEEAVRRLGVIAVAKRAGFSLEEIAVLLAATDGGEPAHRQLRALAAVKLAAVDGLIERGLEMRRWLTAAGACRCDTLEECLLFDR